MLGYGTTIACLVRRVRIYILDERLCIYAHAPTVNAVSIILAPDLGRALLVFSLIRCHYTCQARDFREPRVSCGSSTVVAVLELMICSRIKKCR